MARNKVTPGDAEVETNSEGDTLPAGKGRPTPSRKDQQAARARPLVSNDRKEAKRVSNARMTEERERVRAGMAAGDERFLPARDKGPQRRWLRDYVDARTSIGEFMIPMMGIVLLMTFVPNPTIQLYSVLVIWGFLLLALLDVIFVGFRVKKKLATKFGEDKVQPGFRWYTAMRILQLRVLRLPKPQVKRGKFPE
ncbi:DUF3043 domain-containing protein [Lysinibacter sp. HNR]|uniref:DUF3043 domain-containing protein n=1 Tax=Lysinibacter sp. HNR TaxID=3031408 RepID=UPI002434D2BE|nr:DUF3043 domain-containing protein [Lysinibacter sp. HNR]WGD36238.1 DUF3043 domain-containing protein [Lysinibacter sp. HNR]